MSSEHDKEFLENFEDSPSLRPSCDTGETEEWKLDLGVMILISVPSCRSK